MKAIDHSVTLYHFKTIRYDVGQLIELRVKITLSLALPHSFPSSLNACFQSRHLAVKLLSLLNFVFFIHLCNLTLILLDLRHGGFNVNPVFLGLSTWSARLFDAGFRKNFLVVLSFSIGIILLLFLVFFFFILILVILRETQLVTHWGLNLMTITL